MHASEYAGGVGPSGLPLPALETTVPSLRAVARIYTLAFLWHHRLAGVRRAQHRQERALQTTSWRHPTRPPPALPPSPPSARPSTGGLRPVACASCASSRGQSMGLATAAAAVGWFVVCAEAELEREGVFLEGIARRPARAAASSSQRAAPPAPFRFEQLREPTHTEFRLAQIAPSAAG